MVGSDPEDQGEDLGKGNKLSRASDIADVTARH
jgi:hypothetical protein